MMIYEPQRTKAVVERLTRLGNLASFGLALGSALFWGALFTITLALVTPDIWWLGTIFGVGAGVVLGRLAAAALSAVLEWMAQALVAQGELIARLPPGIRKD